MPRIKRPRLTIDTHGPEHIAGAILIILMGLAEVGMLSELGSLLPVTIVIALLLGAQTAGLIWIGYAALGRKKPRESDHRIVTTALDLTKKAKHLARTGHLRDNPAALNLTGAIVEQYNVLLITADAMRQDAKNDVDTPEESQRRREQLTKSLTTIQEAHAALQDLWQKHEDQATAAHASEEQAKAAASEAIQEDQEVEATLHVVATLETTRRLHERTSLIHETRLQQEKTR